MTELPVNIIKYLCIIAFFKPYTEDTFGFFNYLTNVIFSRNPLPISSIEYFFDFTEKCFSYTFMDLPLEQHRVYFKKMYPYIKNRTLYVNVRLYPINHRVKVQLSELLLRLGVPNEVRPKYLYISKENKKKFIELMLN